MRFIAAFFIAFFAALTAQAFEAGTGKSDITGPIGAPLNGYGDRFGRGATGIHDPLWARALYLNDGESAVILVNCDLTVITRELRARVLELAPQVLPRENIILCATHTHNAQGGMFKQLMPRFVGGRFMPELLESTAQKIAEAMKQAYDSRQRATIGYGTTTQKDLSSNRRFNGGPIDEQIGIIRVDNADGEAIAIAANFAAHPTSVPDEDHLSYSADYPGFYYHELERLAPEGCMALFLNGAEGNQTISGPPDIGGGWARTEGVGRLLAQRVYEAAKEITCGEATLTLNSMDATLPPTLAYAVQPKSVFLQTLEIDGLMMAFFPGEAVVDIGLELRRRALDLGYKAQFSVGLSNDYLMYFIPPDFYPQVNYEAAMNFFGPDISEWFYKHFMGMASRGAEMEAPGAQEPAKEDSQLRAIQGVILEGDGYQRGVQRALFFKDDLDALWEERVIGAIRSGELLPKDGTWGMIPPFVDPVPLALPILGMATRPLLSGLSADAFDELRGVAEAWGKPFDAVWLLQNAAMMTQRGDKTVMFDAPICTNVAVFNSKAVNATLLVGRTMDWGHRERPVLSEVHPEKGRSYLQVGFPWNTGVFNGMNDAGVVICVERMRSLGDPPIQGLTMENFVADCLQTKDNFAEALEYAKNQTHLRGFHVLIAGMEESKARAAVLEYGDKLIVREAGEEEHILLGAVPGSENVDTEARSRYNRANALLAGAENFDMETLGVLMQDSGVDAPGMNNIWNEHTQFSIVFMPERKRILLSAPDAEGKPGAYEMYQLGGKPAP